MSDTSSNILIWGLADFGKPRTRIIVDVLCANANVKQMTCDVWRGVEDKSQLTAWSGRIRIALSALLAYPVLICRFLFSPKPDAVVIPYFGVVDVIILAPFAALRGTPIIWDAFLSLYDTVVDDRRMICAGSVSARMLFRVEALACRLATTILVDTKAHGEYFEARYAGAQGKTRRVFVGAEAAHFKPVPAADSMAPEEATEPFRILFYGQCIPLHGVGVILEAIQMSANDPSLQWSIIGDGQEAHLIEDFVSTSAQANVTWERWVPYPNLAKRIAEADLCLWRFWRGRKSRPCYSKQGVSVYGDGKALRHERRASHPRIVRPN